MQIGFIIRIFLIYKRVGGQAKKHDNDKNFNNNGNNNDNSKLVWLFRTDKEK